MRIDVSVTKCYTMKNDKTLNLRYVYDTWSQVRSMVQGWKDAGYIINSVVEHKDAITEAQIDALDQAICKAL